MIMTVTMIMITIIIMIMIMMIKIIKKRTGNSKNKLHHNKYKDHLIAAYFKIDDEDEVEDEDDDPLALFPLL